MEKWETRSEEWRCMSAAIGQEKNIYVWGASGCGKTSIVKDAMQDSGVNFVYINCIAHFNYKSVFRNILEKYLEVKQILGIGVKDPHKCALALRGVDRTDEIFYVVLDKAHKIIAIDPLVIARLLEISRISACNIKYIVITESYSETLFIHPDTIDREFSPAKIFLPEYTPAQLNKILRKDYNYGPDQDFQGFFDIISQILLPYTTKIFHFRTGFQKAFEMYLNLSQMTSHEKLFHLVARELGNIETSLYQKFNSQREYQQGLSTEAKILIISGFICSKNPPRLDNILLKGKRRTEKRKARQEYSSQIPPEKFSLQRMQAVYSILLHLHQNCTTQIILNTPIETPSFCSLVNTLLQKRIFILISKKDPLGQEKLMCTAEYEFCLGLASSLGIKLNEYVIDFN